MALTLENYTLSNTSKQNNILLSMVKLRQILTRFLMIENLYMKFILTVIAIVLLVIAVELNEHLSDLTHVLWRLYQISRIG